MSPGIIFDDEIEQICGNIASNMIDMRTYTVHFANDIAATVNDYVAFSQLAIQ